MERVEVRSCQEVGASRHFAEVKLCSCCENGDGQLAAEAESFYAWVKVEPEGFGQLEIANNH